MDNFDWSRFVTRININAPMGQLYGLWATRSGMEYWFLRMSEYKTAEGIVRDNEEAAQKGDAYCWRWHGWGDEVTEMGAILDANGKDYFKFSFGEGGDCSVYIKEERGYHIVELVQENIPTSENGKHAWHLGCKAGWTFYLANMKSLVEGGVDLRNRDEQLKQMINS
jgi:uncharacterized protein YndB with AHSA1/START domain